MAMLVAWQTINAVRRPQSPKFTRGFLVVTPGITIKDRLRVLQPNDPDSYYRSRELVPTDLLPDLDRAKIVITNYHAFKLRQRLTLAKGTRELLQGRGKDLTTLESEGQMLQRVMPELLGLKQVMVLNDEAHHCYREKPPDENEEPKFKGDDLKEAKNNREAAWLWISGIEAAASKLDVNRVVDLSATPFFLRGSGYAEGTLFPWTMSDFSLMDAIESGIVKLPRVPVADNIPGDEMPKFRNLWVNIGAKMPKKGLGKAKNLDPLSIPGELQTALEALYGHYARTFADWEEAGIDVPPCFIVVCNNTSTSKLIYNYISGFYRQKGDGPARLENGRLELFRNFDEVGNPYPRPRTLLIDSKQLESGDALDKKFREMASDEIERFKREIVERTGDRRQAENLSDQDLLREVMNTVGKTGRLGDSIRCVVSVSMLTEGWDTNTVTHVMGVRAFGTQLLCEQVIGRALRRQSYDLNEQDRFDVEYADVLGIPFDFTAKPVVVTPKPPRETVQVKAVRPERDYLEIRFPRVAGYRIELPEDRLSAEFSDDSTLELTPHLVGPSITWNEGIIGEGEDLHLEHLADKRLATVAYHLTKRQLETRWRDAGDQPRLHLFGQLKGITRRWLDDHLVCSGNTYPAQLLYLELAEKACERITAAITAARIGDRPVKAILGPYNPVGSTRHVSFNTSKPNRWKTDSRRCHINWVVCDSDWEAEFCRVAEAHPQVRAYVKNHGLGLEVPYRSGSASRTYLPDFIVLVDDGHGEDDLLHLVVEIKGLRGEDAKVKKTTMDTYWVPGVNRLESFGRWAFAEFTDVYQIEDGFAGKDVLDWSELVVQAPPLFIQEKLHPKVLVDDLIRMSKSGASESDESGFQTDLFADFNGLPSPAAQTEFYQHDANWSNRLILGDSLQVMASLAEREKLRGKVQCIYIDPPYGIKFNSNFQWSTTSRDVKDGNRKHITREPEQVRAFRDTWRDGIHSYLTYLRDRLAVARDLLAETGSVFVQIGDENVHLVRSLMDELFGEANFVSQITSKKTTGFPQTQLPNVCDYVVWYAKSKPSVKAHLLWRTKSIGGEGSKAYKPASSYRTLDSYCIKETRLVTLDNLTAQGESTGDQLISLRGRIISPPPMMHWKTTTEGIRRLKRAERIAVGKKVPAYVRFMDDFSAFHMVNVWTDTVGQNQFGGPKRFVVQTALPVVRRCILMTTDPGDLVLDPTCGSGTTAYVAEQCGRRWITIDTSRVALVLARTRLMGARYPYYLLADSPEGQRKEGELTRTEPSRAPTYGNIRQGFVYKRAHRITLKSIAHNAEIDVIWEEFQERLDSRRERLNGLLGKSWEEWEVPRKADGGWSAKAQRLHAAWWKQRIARQKEIDKSIRAKADYEYRYDQPYEDSKKVRVAGPFTVESISPHRALTFNEDDELIDHAADARLGYQKRDFDKMIPDYLRTSGVQQAQKRDRIVFSAVRPWPGNRVCAEGIYYEGGEDSGVKRRAAIVIGAEFGTVSRPDLVEAAIEAAEGGFDVLVACAFSYDAHTQELHKLGRVRILKARMNADLHMGGDLKNTGKGNLFVIFGEPDIDILEADGGQVQVRINGVDVFHPATGEIRSDNADGIACWFIDTDYNAESFFVRHAYFLGANDPYKALKATLKAEIDLEAWESLRSSVSRPFDPPASGRIAVKVINHLGDEVMKVFPCLAVGMDSY